MRNFKRLTENTFPELVAEHQANLEPCPNNITDVILRILQTGVLEARRRVRLFYGASDDDGAEGGRAELDT